MELLQAPAYGDSCTGVPRSLKTASLLKDPTLGLCPGGAVSYERGTLVAHVLGPEWRCGVLERGSKCDHACPQPVSP